ncbi:MAG: hypothetical protein K6G84_00590 [Lachnospiraceae bacterium]|nr:hypothetical protein [Lachnospiraceae bacterium]
MDTIKHILTQSDEDEFLTRYDTAAKEILMDRMVLVPLLKTVIPEMKTLTEDEIWNAVSEDNIVRNDFPELRNHGDSVEMDRKIRAVLPNKMNLVIDIEPQGSFNPGYFLGYRMEFYVAGATFDQLGRNFSPNLGKEYNDLYKVYSVWILFNTPKYMENTIFHGKMNFNPVIGEMNNKIRDYFEGKYGIMNIITVSLSNYSETDEGFLGELNVLFDDKLGAEEKIRILKNRFGMEPSEIVKKGINTMSEGYGAAVLERAENKGFDKGYDKGTTNERTRMTKLFKYLRTNGLEAEMDKALDNPEYMKKLFKLYNM